MNGFVKSQFSISIIDLFFDIDVKPKILSLISIMNKKKKKSIIKIESF